MPAVIAYLTNLGVPLWATESAIVVALFCAAAIAGILLHLALRGALDRLFGRDRPLWHTLLKRTRGVARYGLILLMISFLLPLAPLGTETNGTVHRILVAAIVILLGWIALTAVDIVAYRYTAKFKLDAADNLLARKAVTQMRVLHRAADVLLIIVTAAFALMTFDSVRQFGISLFASAGIAGIAVGLAARPVLSNLIAGVQLAITQPIRIDDVLIVEGEYGQVEEINSTYIVLKLWDLRRLIVPLCYFFDKPFQNWTRMSASLIGSVMINVDYTASVEAIRTQAIAIAKQSKLWDGSLVNLQVSDAKENAMELRVLVSARNSGDTWDLRCEMREKLLAFIQANFPQALPRRRMEVDLGSSDGQDRLASSATDSRRNASQPAAKPA